MADQLHVRCRVRSVGRVAVLSTVLVALACSGDTAGTDTCEEVAGRTEAVEIDGDEAIVYLPPCHDDLDDLATVYLLHGAGMTPNTWIAPPISAVDQLDELISTDVIAPVVVVFPPRSTMQTGFDDVVLDPLIEQIELRYDVADDARRRGIGGFSAGGPPAATAAFGAEARVAALGLFASIWSSAVSDDVIEGYGDRSDPPTVRIDVGDRDALGRNVPVAEQVLGALGASVETTIASGGHDFAFVAVRLPEWMRWFERHLVG